MYLPVYPPFPLLFLTIDVLLLLSLNNNIDAVKTIQADQMAKWRKQAEAMCDWMDVMDDKLEALENENNNQDIKSITKNLQECEVLW